MIAYLNSEYPSLSHTFIEREIRALRARGWQIVPFSVRRTGEQARLGSANADAAKETVNLLDGGVSRLLGAAVAAALGSPMKFFGVLAAAMNLSPPGLRYRVKHLGYVAEAAVLARELKSRGIRHVHVHMANNGAAVALLACRLDPALSYSLTIHGSAEFFHVDSWTLKEKVEGAVFTRCISDFCKSQVMTWTDPGAWGRFHVVHCGIDAGVFTPAPKPAAGPLRLLTVGRFHPIKAYPLLIEACKMLSDEGIDWTLDMVGDGSERALVERKIAELGLGGRVKLSGAVGQDQIGRHFDDADAMVISSFMEGVPVVLMEAMAKGLVVLSTNVGGVPELVERGVSGELVQPGSAERLAEGLRCLARKRAEFPRMAAAGRQKILDEFTVEHVADGMEKLFRKYVGS